MTIFLLFLIKPNHLVLKLFLVNQMHASSNYMCLFSDLYALSYYISINGIEIFHYFIYMITGTDLDIKCWCGQNLKDTIN
jgi:hypothetical protein